MRREEPSAPRMVGGQRWTHPSVLKLLDAAPVGTDPNDIIKAKARELIDEAKAYGWSGPPFNLEQLASFRRIKVEQGPPTLVQDAMIMPDENGQLTICWNPERPTQRKNFNIGHEIAHTFFPDCAELVRHRSADPDRFDPDRELEKLCDVGGAELLFPEPDFLASLAALGGPSLAAITDLKDQYEGSWEATANRVARLSDSKIAIVVLVHALKPKELDSMQSDLFEAKPTPAPTPRIRIEYGIPSASFPDVFFPRHKSVPDDSCLYELLEGEDVVTGRERWEIRDLNNTLAVEGLSLPPRLDGSARVLALLRIH